MNMSKLRADKIARATADQSAINEATTTLKTFSTARVQTALEQAKKYEVIKGSRCNRNFIRACEQILYGVSTS